ncbi:MAG TPA: AsmA-like C-terminal region-containing protein, partial [Alphaproteobacteria bacterium]|nr:AsmA-like C-terminal region-containing protein [Alphaproteobacteria bacterium]
WLDLDKLAQLERRAATPQRALRPAETTGARLGVSQLPSVASAYPAIDLALDLGIEAVGLNGGTLRQMRLNAVMSRGDLVINQASALLPGETEVAGFAQIAFGVDTPRIDGNISARSDNLRGLLEWFGLDSSGVPAGRLRRFEGKARIEGTPSHVELTGVHVAFDSTKATAGFAVALGDRLGIGADIKVDQINVDAYALAADAAKAGKDKPPLLERFDANVTLAAHTVTWAGEPLNGVSLDALLQGGDVVLRSAVISEVLGARVEARGKVASVARRPSASLEVSVDAGDASRLLRLADLVPFTPVPLSLRGGLQTEPNGEIALDGIDLTYGDTHLRGKGRLGGAKKRLAVDLATQHLMIDSLPRVLPDDGGSFGLDAVINAETLSWGVYRLAGARVEAHIDGGAPVALDVTGGLFGGALDFTARSEAADRGKLGGSLSLRDADLASGFAAVLGTDAISGRGDLRAAFSAPARFGSEIWAGLSGSIEMTVRDGAIAGIDLPLMRSMLDPNDPPADIVDLLGAGLHGATPFTALNATARVHQGALAIETLRVATPVGEATGSGGADLARGTVDLSLTVPIAGDGVPPILLQVKGPVDEARVALDFSKLQRYLNRREAEMPGQDDSTQ